MSLNKKLLFSSVSVFLSFVVLIFSVSTYFSHAWFSTNTDVKDTGAGVSVGEQKFLCDYSIYAYDLSLQRATDYETVKGEPVRRLPRDSFAALARNFPGRRTNG